MVRALSAGKLSSCRAGVQQSGALIHLLNCGVRTLPVGRLSSGKEGAQGSESQLCLLAEDEVLKATLSKKLCCFCGPCTLLFGVVSERPRIQNGTLT